MKLTEEEMESAKCALIDETSDFILERVCDVMYDQCQQYTPEPLDEALTSTLKVEQIDEVVCAVFKGLYYEKEETKQ